MSKISDLIESMCPNGVRFCKIGEVAEVGTGSSNGNESDDNGKFPFFVRSQTIKRKNTYEYDEEAIIIPGEGGIGEIFHYINGKYALHQRVYRIHFISNLIDSRFAYYYLSAYFKAFILRKAVSATVTSIRKPMIEQFPIPLPPLPVQQEIVRILDHFTELTAELTARRKQYAYYRDALLTFGDEVEHKKISDFSRVSIGEFVHKSKQRDDYQYPVFNGGTSNTGYYEEYNRDANKIIVSARGANAGYVNRVFEKFWSGNSCYTIDLVSEDGNWNYVYYFLKAYEAQLLGSQQKGGIPAVSKKQIEKFSVPIPTIEKQSYIVSILDHFYGLCNDLTSGLPAEINARQKQYEYYRDKLLSFPERS